ncbi:hypothetical protein GCM10009639_21140 [Kitasatospora putterlickiae]|uniref:Integral membrane protein n=1 Tax=Kitasatospora putterlickiae TaxID=221725 RepID=A0ABN1XW25_9ACTN
MCWSARADLVAGGAVTAVGVLCLARAHRSGRPERLPLAALPLVLGVHQLIEAAVWLGADGELPAAPAAWARTAWAVIALPVLPLLVPIGVRRAAVDAGRTRRRLLSALVLLGLLVAAPLAHALATHPVDVTAHAHTLDYRIGIPHPVLLLAGYLLATVGALLLSGDLQLRRLGLLTTTAALICALLWHLAFISTWCALAAITSTLLLRWTSAPPPHPHPARPADH